MDDLAVIFEQQHTHLGAVAYRLLGSVCRGRRRRPGDRSCSWRSSLSHSCSGPPVIIHRPSGTRPTAMTNVRGAMTWVLLAASCVFRRHGPVRQDENPRPRRRWEVPALGDVSRRRMCARGGGKPVVGGAACCTRSSGRRRAQAVAGVDSSEDRRRRDRRDPNPCHEAVAWLSADQRGATTEPEASGIPAIPDRTPILVHWRPRSGWRHVQSRPA